MGYYEFHNCVLRSLSKAIRVDKEQNSKLQLRSEVYVEIKMSVSTDSDDPRETRRLTDLSGEFIEWITEISGLINSYVWNGEDVTAIFINEFNRYKRKSEAGQAFTPDHVTSFVYRLLNVKNDRILDAVCGSGAFLVKAMANMIQEAGGVRARNPKQIKEGQLYGIEFDREIFVLACAYMVIHKDGKNQFGSPGLTHRNCRELDGSHGCNEGAREPSVREQIRVYKHCGTDTVRFSARRPSSRNWGLRPSQ